MRGILLPCRHGDAGADQQAAGRPVQPGEPARTLHHAAGARRQQGVETQHREENQRHHDGKRDHVRGGERRHVDEGGQQGTVEQDDLGIAQGDEETQRRIDKISNAAERSAKIVKTFLAMARQQPAKMEPVDLRSVITTSVDVTGYGKSRDGLEIASVVPEDIPEISDYFVERFCRRPVRIPDSHIRKMMKYPWPGNVRELRNVIERAALLLQGDEIRPADLLLQDSLSSPLEKSSQKTMNIREIIPLEEVKRRHILSALRACSGNKSLTARSLGVSLSTLKRKLREMNIT